MKKSLRIDFISKDNLSNKSFNQKFNMIMEKVKKGGIIVLEESLTNTEKTELIEKSLKYVSDSFPGIEFAGFDGRKNWFYSIMEKFTGREKREGMVIVGRTDVIQNLEQHKDTISFLAKV